MKAQSARPSLDPVELVCAALSAGGYSGLTEFLQKIAEAFNAYGCLLWELAPGVPVYSPKAAMYALAQWLPGGKVVDIYDNSLTESCTGGAVRDKKPVRLKDVRKEGGHHRDHPIIQQEGLGPMLVVPVSFTDGVPGAVSLFRKEDCGEFSQDDETRLQQLGALVPPIYQAIREKMSLDLLAELDNILRDTEVRDSQNMLSPADISFSLRQICEHIGRSLGCYETTIYLEDPMVAPGVFRRMATTQPELAKKLAYTDTGDDCRNTITGWILAHGKPVHIFDLFQFEQDKERLNERYPGMGWRWMSHEPQLADELRHHDLSPPWAYIASPILTGQTTMGAIRCFVAPKRPYFGIRDLDLLKLVAAQIAQYWRTWVSRRQVHKENDSWERLSSGISNLKKAAQKALEKHAFDDKHVLDRALSLLNGAVPGFDILDVRLLDESRRFLHFTNWCGKAWTDEGCHAVRDPLSRVFPVDETPPASGGAYVFQHRTPLFINDTQWDKYYSACFTNVKRVIMAPIAVGEDFFGVLDIYGTQEVDFPGHAQVAAELIADQLGVYHYLMLRMNELRNVESALKSKVSQLEKLQKVQALTFEDLAHQLKGPLLQAQARATNAIQGATRELPALRGLCRKSLSVARGIGVLADLQAGRPLKLKREAVEQDLLTQLLIEAAADNQALVDPDRKVFFQVLPDKVVNENLEGITFDIGLLEQAINTLLDNAAKYSYDNTRVFIHGGLTNTKRFFICVQDEGLPIRQSEISKCKERGWRSDAAQSVVGDGSGVGLWIVDNIMKAHKGDLEILATRDNITQVRLILGTPGSGK